jgi:threonine dehydratase
MVSPALPKPIRPFQNASEAVEGPSLATVRETAERIRPHIVQTPVHRWKGPAADRLFGADAEVWLKLELLQVTGSFKARGALNSALQLPPSGLGGGLTAFSSGNHAAAVAYAAQVLGITAKVVMLSSANPARVRNCRSFGGEVLFAPDGEEAVEMVRRLQAEEGRTPIHPYEGPHTAAGAGTLALELCAQIPGLDAVLVAVGGGGLCAGVGPVVKALQPGCEVLAVEPVGADTMYRSFRSGRPEPAVATKTIADSLAPPHVLPYSFALCRQSVDQLALISDEEMCAAMSVMFTELKLAVEPGGAAATAGAMGAFRPRLAGKRIAIVVCGSNIDLASLARFIAAAPGG